MSSMAPVDPKNTRGARDFFLIPTGIASNAPMTENIHDLQGGHRKQDSGYWILWSYKSHELHVAPHNLCACMSVSLQPCKNDFKAAENWMQRWRAARKTQENIEELWLDISVSYISTQARRALKCAPARDSRKCWHFLHKSLIESSAMMHWSLISSTTSPFEMPKVFAWWTNDTCWRVSKLPNCLA